MHPRFLDKSSMSDAAYYMFDRLSAAESGRGAQALIARGREADA